jgi:hypothetical protein
MMKLYPDLKKVAYEFDMSTYTLGFSAINGNFVDVTCTFNSDEESTTYTLTEDDLGYWECAVLYYEEQDQTAAFSLHDVHRAAQVCHHLQEVPSTDKLMALIGFSSTHNTLPDCWGVVLKRLNMLKSFTDSYNPLAEGAD